MHYENIITETDVANGFPTNRLCESYGQIRESVLAVTEELENSRLIRWVIGRRRARAIASALRFFLRMADNICEVE